MGIFSYVLVAFLSMLFHSLTTVFLFGLSLWGDSAEAIPHRKTGAATGQRLRQQAGTSSADSGRHFNRCRWIHDSWSDNDHKVRPSASYHAFYPKDSISAKIRQFELYPIQFIHWRPKAWKRVIHKIGSLTLHPRAASRSGVKLQSCSADICITLKYSTCTHHANIFL